MAKFWQWVIVLYLVGLVAAAIGGQSHFGAAFITLLLLPIVAAVIGVIWIDAANRKADKGKTSEQKQAELNALVDRVADHRQRELESGRNRERRR